MAEVVQCDVCGRTEPPEKTKFISTHYRRNIKIFDVMFDNTTSSHITKDICSSCYDKLMKFLGGEADVVPRHLETTD